MDEYKAFQPPASTLEDAPSPGMTLADRGARLGAVLLDGLILGSVGIVAAVFIPFNLSRRGQHNSTGALVAMGGAIGVWILVLLVWNLVWVHRYGQSIGKRIVKIRVVRSNGERASLARILFLRNLPFTVIGWIPILGPVLSLVDSLMIFRESTQCLHDQIADTLVIRA